MTEPGDVTAFFRQYTHDTIAAVDRLPLGQVRRVVELLSEARSLGQQIFICGNGGSAATASHFANDLGKGASLGRSERFRVMSLTDNIPWITSLANDLDYSQIFVEQADHHSEMRVERAGAQRRFQVHQILASAQHNGSGIFHARLGQSRWLATIAQQYPHTSRSQLFSERVALLR